jgi:MFS family permease
MPAGVSNAYWFQIFNATSWSLVLGTPMLLYLKSLGASALILGVTVAMIPLFGALQIPAANFVERVGYKNFVVRGWTSRSIFILGVAASVFLPASLPVNLRIGLILLMMALFAAARGISVCGYLPWITHLVPENVRGAFISRDSMCMYTALTGTMLLSSWWVGRFPSTRTFGFLFLLSYLSALVSLIFLRRIPDVQTVKPKVAGSHPPWKEMLLFPPFFRFVLFNVVFNLFIAALGVVWVPFMKDGFMASNSLVLSLSAYSSIIAAVISLLMGSIVDRTGSRPLMAFSSLLILVSQALWMTLAAGALPRHPVIPFLIVTFGALGYPMLGLASTRLLMGLVPATGRSHFFAISSVSISLTLGVMPVLWGLALDSLDRTLGDGFAVLPNWTWNRYSLFYAVVLMGTLGAQFFRRRLDEPKAMSTDEFLRLLLVQSPGRLLARALAPIRRFMPPG